MRLGSDDGVLDVGGEFRGAISSPDVGRLRADAWEEPRKNLTLSR